MVMDCWMDKRGYSKTLFRLGNCDNLFSQSIVKIIRRFIVHNVTFATRGTSMKTKHEVTQVDMLTHKVVLEFFQFKFTLYSPKPLSSNSDLMNHTVILSKHVGNF